MSEKRTIAIHSLMLSSSSYYVMALGALMGFFIAKILGPLNYGIISGLQVAVIFSSLSHIGFLHAASVELPKLRVKGDKEGIEKTLSVTFYMSIVPSALLALVVIFIALKKRGQISPTIFWGTVTLGFTLFFAQVKELIVNTYIRGWNRFDIQSKASALIATIVAPLTLLAVIFSGIYGQYGFRIISLLLFPLLVSRFVPLKFGKGWSWSVWKSMFFIGFPMVLEAFLQTCAGNVDRLLILGYMKGDKGLHSLGVYTIGIRILEFLQGVVYVIYSIMLPRFQERFTSSNGDKRSLIELIHGPSILFTTGMAIASGFSLIGAQYLIYNWLEQYKPGITPMKIVAWSATLMLSSSLCSITLITMRRLWLRFSIALVGALLICAGNWLALKMGYGIIGVAATTLGGRAFSAVALLVIVGGFLWPAKKTLNLFFRLMIPIASIMATIFLSDQWCAYGRGFIRDFPTLLTQCSLVAIVGVLLTLLLKGQTSAWDAGVNIIRGNLTRFIPLPSWFYSRKRTNKN